MNENQFSPEKSAQLVAAVSTNCWMISSVWRGRRCWMTETIQRRINRNNLLSSWEDKSGRKRCRAKFKTRWSRQREDLSRKSPWWPTSCSRSESAKWLNDSADKQGSSTWFHSLSISSSSSGRQQRSIGWIVSSPSIQSTELLYLISFNRADRLDCFGRVFLTFLRSPRVTTVPRSVMGHKAIGSTTDGSFSVWTWYKLIKRSVRSATPTKLWWQNSKFIESTSSK